MFLLINNLPQFTELLNGSNVVIKTKATYGEYSKLVNIFKELTDCVDKTVFLVYNFNLNLVCLKEMRGSLEFPRLNQRFRFDKCQSKKI